MVAGSVTLIVVLEPAGGDGSIVLDPVITACVDTKFLMV